MLEVERADIFRDTGTYTCTFSERFSWDSLFSSKSKAIEVEKRLTPRVDLWTENEAGGVFPVVVGRETEVICHADRGQPRPEITASVGEEGEGPSPRDRVAIQWKKIWLEKSLQFWLEIPYPKKKVLK